ncbi:MAG TPA: CvpA family protein, partial [Candidatus Tumulicola sp.]|nr:CvpA family protein [Candidatus Tumulicola sp.]
GGYRAGVVRELIGLAAILIAWLLAGAFAGPFSDSLGIQLGVSVPVAHLIGFWLLFLVVFAAVRAGGWLLEKFASLPIIKIVSGIGGGIVASAKAVLLLWLLLFVALFFPISADVRAAMRASPSARAIDALDTPAYAMLESALPRTVRVVAGSILKHHRL